MRRLLSAALACLLSLASGPQASAQPALPFRERPPLNTDEGGLWAISDDTEEAAARSGERIRAPALEAYVRDITCRVAAEYCGDIRLYLMQRPYFNASMAPNGYMEVWSGLLLRAEDEAQLSFVLGHEITHYVERHSLESFRATRSRARAAFLLSIGASAAGAGAVGDLIYLGAIASLFGFSREAETEADAAGFDRASSAGYDPAAAAALWNNLIAETQASDFPRVRARAVRASIFNSHPVTAERVAALTRRAEARGAGGVTERERYRAMVRPYLGAWLRDEVRRRDFGQVLNLIDRMARQNEDLGVLSYYRGEVYRARRGEGDLALARAAYEAAIAHPDAPAAAWRELGDIAVREQRIADARALFEDYLARDPAAPDRELIAQRLRALGGPTP